MSDLWSIASEDHEAEVLETHLTTARLAAAQYWPVVAAANDEHDFANRLALVDDNLATVASNIAAGDPVLFGVVHSAIKTAFTEDFTLLHETRVQAAREAVGRRGRRVAAESGHVSYVEPVRTTDDGIRSITIHTDGAVGAEGDARARAEQEFGGTAFISFRSSDSGDLVFVYTDKQPTTAARKTAASEGDTRITNEAGSDKFQAQVFKNGVWGDIGDSVDTREQAQAKIDSRTTSSRKTAGQTCSVCGDAIEKDPSGEANAGWHHDNGEKHDHEAKPSGDSKESSRRVAFAPPQEEYDAGAAAGATDASNGLPPRVDLTTLTQRWDAPEGGGPNYWTQGYAAGYQGTVVAKRRQASLINPFARTAGENPFAKKDDDEKKDGDKPEKKDDGGNPFAKKDDAAADPASPADPNAEPVSSDTPTDTSGVQPLLDAGYQAHTQGGKTLEEAIAAGEPIQFQPPAATSAAPGAVPAAAAPTTPPVQPTASRRPFAGSKTAGATLTSDYADFSAGDEVRIISVDGGEYLIAKDVPGRADIGNYVEAWVPGSLLRMASRKTAEIEKIKARDLKPGDLVSFNVLNGAFQRVRKVTTFNTDSADGPDVILDVEGWREPMPTYGGADVTVDRGRDPMFG